MKRNIKAPTGTELTCKNWLIEAAYLMIQNNLDAEVAFDPENLIVYGGRGKAARNWEQFDEYERQGLMMYGQMTAGSWIYIGTQGILQGTYETFGSLARQHGWGDLAGKLVLTAGLGEMGGAQPQAVTFNGGVGIFVEVDPWRIERRLQLKQV